MCDCQDVDIGSYDNQVVLETPSFMLDIGSLGCYTFRPTTCVDTCLAEEVESLWTQGIVTVGCCCGHNKKDPYISVWDDSIEDMEELGYEHHDHPMFSEANYFEPKTV